MRVMMELRPDPVRHDIRHLCVVKGNYLSEEYKHDSFELRFTSALNFEATGNGIPFAMLKERDTEKESADAERLELIQSLREEGKSYQEIADILDLSKTSVFRACKKIE